MNRKSNGIIGGILIVTGIVVLLSRFDLLRLGDYNPWNIFGIIWPLLFLILPGFIFHLKYFDGKERAPGLLVPGGILVITGITCQLCMVFPFLWEYLWPWFITAPAVGLLELYVFSMDKEGKRPPGLLVPVGILFTIAVVCQVSMLFNLWEIMWPGFILAPAVGLFLLYYFGKREKGLLIPVGILGGISLLFFALFGLGFIVSGAGGIILPLLLLFSGLLLLVKNRNAR